MKSYKYPYEYKDEILERLKKYETSAEKTGDYEYEIELKLCFFD